MYWQDNRETNPADAVPDDIVDLSFKVSCRSLPLDHAYALSSTLSAVLPWIETEEHAGIHLIHGAESGNGWLRPDNPDDIMYLSRRTRLTLRLPKERVPDAQTLQGQTLDVGGNALTLGDTRVRPLSAITTIFSRYVVTDEAADETKFLNHANRWLEALGIRVKKMMSGRIHTLAMPDRTIFTRSLMIDGLEVEESIRLQQHGLGPGRTIGCGLFLPHKGIDAVGKTKRLSTREP